MDQYYDNTDKKCFFFTLEVYKVWQSKPEEKSIQYFAIRALMIPI